MAYEQHNYQAVIDYFRAGEKGACARVAQGANACGALGVEIEHFVVRKDTHKAVLYEAPAGQPSVHLILESLASYYQQRSYGTKGELIGLSCAEASITLEPAAQLEISIAPYAQIKDIMRAYSAFRHVIDPLLEALGCELVTQGYHPSACARELPLIPKRRYELMDAHFQALGTHGERMMRASASTQVSIDYANEADAIRKMRVAQALVPVFASLFENTKYFEGSPAGRMARLIMWRDVDAARCGCVPGLFSEGFGFESYASWVLNTCPIFITRPAPGSPSDAPRVCSLATPGITAAQAYADIPMNTQDVEHLLSMFWPDVRLKRFVEIRPVDALPLERALGYAALVKGLFYCEDSLGSLEEALGVSQGRWPFDNQSVDQAIDAVARQGEAACLYGRTLRAWKELVGALARKALPEQELVYLDQVR